MDHLTRHYRHLCEQLQEKINVLEKFLIERPSIEDQIKAAEEAEEAVSSRKPIKVKTKNVALDIGFGTAHLPKGTQGQFSSKLGVFLDVGDMTQQSKSLGGKPPELITVSPESKPTVLLAVDSGGNYDNDTGRLTSRAQGVVAHEAGGHGFQNAAQIRDIAAGKKVDPIKDILQHKERASSDTERLKSLGASPKEINQKEFASYRLGDPNEVNARSLEGGRAAHRYTKVAAQPWEVKQFFGRSMAMNIGMNVASRDENVDLPPQSTRHERSVLKRQKLLAAKDRRSAVARGIQMGERERTMQSAVDLLGQQRSNEIKRRIEFLKGNKPEVSPTKSKIETSAEISPSSKTTTTQASKSASSGAMNKGMKAIGKVSDILDPMSTAVETGIGKISRIGGMAAGMYGLADTIFGKEAGAPSQMMEPERKEQEERDELLSAAMNPQDKPVASRAPVELKRSEFRRKSQSN